MRCPDLPETAHLFFDPAPGPFVSARGAAPRLTRAMAAGWTCAGGSPGDLDTLVGVDDEIDEGRLEWVWQRTDRRRMLKNNRCSIGYRHQLILLPQ